MAENHSCQILLVDPEQSDSQVIQSVLAESDVVVHYACSAEQALDIFASHSIDIVLTELNLGEGIDGLELMNRLSLVDHSVKVILLTHDQHIDKKLRALAAGAFDYLQKPIAHSQLLQHAVTRAHGFSRLQHQNQNLLLQLETTRDQLVVAETALQTVKKKFTHLAVTDSLTNLRNRRYVEQMLKQEVDRRNRYKTALSLAFIDIDGFTPLCEKFGHEISNFILKDIARLLLQCSRTSDIVGRFAADVFVVLLPETTPQNALIFADRVRDTIAAAHFETSDEQTTQLSVSVGVSGIEVTSGTITDKQFTLAASKALQNAKRGGTGQVRSFPELPDTQNSSNHNTKAA